MFRVTQQRHAVAALPMIRIVIICAKQASRPLVVRLIKVSTGRPWLKNVIINCGRLSYAVSDFTERMTRDNIRSKVDLALFLRAQQARQQQAEAAKAAEKAAEGEEEFKEIAKDGEQKMKQAASTDATAVPKDEKKAGGDHADHKPTTPVEELPDIEIQATAQGRRARKVKKVDPTHSELLDAGASMLVEMFAYLLMVVLMTYEVHLASVTAKEKEAQMEQRFAQLEDRIVELEKKHSAEETTATRNAADTNKSKSSWFKRGGQAAEKKVGKQGKTVTDSTSAVATPAAVGSTPSSGDDNHGDEETTSVNLLPATEKFVPPPPPSAAGVDVDDSQVGQESSSSALSSVSRASAELLTLAQKEWHLTATILVGTAAVLGLVLKH